MKKLVIFTIFLVFINILSVNASSHLSFNIDTAEIKKTKILFEKFNYLEEEKTQKVLVSPNGVVLTPPPTPEEIERIRVERETLMEDILTTVEADLKTTDLFEVIKGDDGESESNLIIMEEDRIFLKYKDSGLDAVLSGEYTINAKDEIELKVMLWDILDERQILGKYYIIKRNNWKRLAHVVADKIYEGILKEERGIFDSKILYVAETGSAKERVKRIAIMDYDGDNLQYLTNGETLVLTPIFSKAKKSEVFFLEYIKKDKPKIYKMDLQNGEVVKIGNFKYMTFAPNFNPVGENSMLFSVSEEDGVSNIYKMNLDTNAVTKLTFDKSINTVPSYSPDGKKIVFTSDRSGSRKLYVMDENGVSSSVKRISTAKGTYDKPSWSPDGRLIAFVKIQNGEFALAVMTPNGQSERILTSAYLLEGVKWSPNGRYLLYSKQRGPFGKDSIPYIYIMDIYTGHEYRLPTPIKEGATDPDWVNK